MTRYRTFWQDFFFSCTHTVGSKIIRALAIVLAIFFWFDCQFFHLMLVINSINSKDYDLTFFSQNCIRYEFFLTRLISSARIILRSTVHYKAETNWVSVNQSVYMLTLKQRGLQFRNLIQRYYRGFLRRPSNIFFFF